MKSFFASETKLKVVKGYNEHENTGQVQEVGTCAVVFDELATMVDSMDVEKQSLDNGFE